MKVDPGLDVGAIGSCLFSNYGVRVGSVAFLPLGDVSAAHYEVVGADGVAYFLKVTFGAVNAGGLRLASALVDLGVPNVLAPLRTRAGGVSCPIDGHPGASGVLFPFVRGQNAQVAGLSDEQWRAFGSTLRGVHDSGLVERFRDVLAVETFALPSAAKVRRMLAVIGEGPFEGPSAARFIAFLREHDDRIRQVLGRAEELGARLRRKSFENVVCHADIHAANILVSEDGRISLIDWDGPPDPMIAPRQRDLLFVVGSRIARTVEPQEEDLFFEGYGPVAIDREELIYYRYERIVEDLGEFGDTILLDPDTSELARAEAVDIVEGIFAPGGMVESAEVVGIR